MSDETAPRRLAVIGAGKMGDTLISALVESGIFHPTDIVATAAHVERLERIAKKHGVSTTLDNAAAVRDADVVFLCVKPQIAASVLDELRPAMTRDHLLISIVAGLPTRMIEDHAGDGIPVVRAMPNTPSRIGCGMTTLCGGTHASAQQLEASREMFARIGRAIVLDEKHFDAVTAVGASGPAFLYVVIEALAEGGVKVGLPRKVATELAAQACLGASRMVLDSGEHPALLKDEVTTPAGCTIDGLLALEAGGLRVTLIQAVVEATRRSRELVDG